MASARGSRQKSKPEFTAISYDTSARTDKEHELTIFGKNGMFNDVYDLGEAFEHDKFDDLTEEIYSAGRPTNFLNKMLRATTFWQPYALMDYYMREVSILATIKSRSVKEIFRYGIDWEPKFVRKCAECGREYDNAVVECDCGSKKLYEPDKLQQDYFGYNGVSFLDKANRSGQSLKRVWQMFAESQYQNNMGYIGVITADFVDENGKLYEQMPIEIVNYDPKFVKRLFDESAVPGKEECFATQNRGVSYSQLQYPDLMMEDGTKLHPAFYRVGNNYGAVGEVWFYDEDEIFCDNWFSPSQTYGVPIWLDIEDDIISYHFMEKHQCKRWEHGYVRGLLVFPGFNKKSMLELSKSIKNVLAKNDNSIPMVALPPAVPGTGTQEVKFITLTNDTASDLMTYKNDIRDRLCGRAGVPNLIVTDTEASGGLNNESQQLTTFDRYLTDMYDNVDYSFNTWLLPKWFPKITDWKLVVRRPPKMNTELKEKMENAQYATTMKNLGFAPISQKDGVFQFPEKPQDPNAGMGGGMGMGGMMPSFR